MSDQAATASPKTGWALSPTHFDYNKVEISDGILNVFIVEIKHNFSPLLILSKKLCF
jgi:hypothetical protein